MTRKSEGATAGLRRGRTLATAGFGAATLIGGLIYAMPANAATNPTASVAMPASILNDGTPATATITLTGGDVTYNNLLYKFTLTIPGDSSCTGVAVAPSATNPGPAGTLSGCVFTVTGNQSIAANAAATPNKYDIAVNNASASGTASLAFEIDQTDGSGGFLRTLATANGSAPISGPAAATFNKVPNAIVKQNYTQQLIKPAVGGSPSTTVYQSVTRTDPVTNVTTTCYEVDSTTTTVNGVVYTVLNDDLALDPISGKIISGPHDVSGTTKAAPVYGPNGGSDSNPASYIVVTNNGTGGAGTTAAAGTCADATLATAGAVSTPAVAAHDVSSGAFQIPVVFKDVPLNGTFAKQIYSLGDAGQSTGYADGSFQPTSPITRQAMAALLDFSYSNYGSDTSCVDISVASPYSDLPATSPFCAAIYQTSNLGLFNGYAGGTFQPTKNISRQAISAVLFRQDSYDRLGEVNGDAACTTPVPFNDVSTQNQFCGDIEWMSTNGISKGYSDGGFHPAANSSRQATAAFIYGLQQLENS
jgi:hypothetical protein